MMQRIVAAPSAISARGLLHRVRSSGVGVALVVSLVGWTVLWASGLHVIALPPWLGATFFFAGLALIPFAQSPARTSRLSSLLAATRHLTQRGVNTRPTHG